MQTINPFTPTNLFSSFQIIEWKSPIKLLCVERVKDIQKGIIISKQNIYSIKQFDGIW